VDQTKRPLGAATMVYEDYFFLERWYRYYDAQIGGENLFVFSHGDDPRHQEIAEKASVIAVPREDSLYKFDRRRWRMMSLFISGMLEFYNWMILSDVDEIMVADPDLAPDLVSFITATYGDFRKAPASVAPFALDMVHVPDLEPLPIEDGATILSRRRTFRPSRVYSKPCLVRAPVIFGPGGHRNNLGPRHLSDGLYLLHLKYFDEPMLRARAEQRRKDMALAITLNTDFSEDHQWMKTYHEYELTVQNNDVLGEDIQLPEFRAAMMRQTERHPDQYIWGKAQGRGLYRIPERFASVF